jgi:glutamate transport system substrate-binding protein
VAGGVDAVTTDDTILAGYAAQDQYKGKLKVVGNTFSTENYGIGLKKGDTELCQKVTDAIKKMIDDGSWQKAVDANLGPAGYKPGPGNPPTPDACS